MKEIQAKKDCWELFSVPTVSSTGHLNDEDTVKLTFQCDKTNTSMNVYYQKEDNIDVQTLSKIMNSALSLCLRCTGKKPHCDSGYIVH